MSNPWHDEELDALVVYLESAPAAGATAWAVVEASSARLADEVLERLRARLDPARVRVLEAGGVDGGAAELDALLEPAPAGTDITVVRGLSEALTGGSAEEVAGWLNLRREELEHPGESRVVVLTSDAFDAWLRLAADLHRYAQQFRFIDWEDLFEAGRAAAAKLNVERTNLQARLDDALARVERARAVGSESALARLLATAAGHAYRLGRIDILRSVVADAVKLTEGLATRERLWVLKAQGTLEGLVGQSRAAMETARSAARLAEGLPSLRRQIDNQLGVAAQAVGATAAAESYHASSLENAADANDLALDAANLAELHLWRGRQNRAREFVAAALKCHDADYLVAILSISASIHASLGELGVAIRDCGRALQLSDEVGAGYVLADAVLCSSAVAVASGAPEVAARLGSNPAVKSMQSAMTLMQVWVPALVAWSLGGPEAVEPVVAEHAERQATWDAPIPAAELAFARGLASASDAAARPHLQDAADRYRAMDGQLFLAEIERRLARLDRLAGNYDAAEARLREGLAWHEPEGARPAEARDRIELAMLALARGDVALASVEAQRALALIRECGTRLDEPAALVCLAASERAQGRRAVADSHDARWRRLVAGMGAAGLSADLERDAAWAAGLTTGTLRPTQEEAALE